MEENKVNDVMEKKPKDCKKGCLIGCLATVVIFALLIVAIVVVAINKFGGYEEEVYYECDYVQIIEIEGTIASSNTNQYGVAVGYQHNDTLALVDELIEDEFNKGIILDINSGGGGVYESDELYLKLMEYKEETGRPIYAYYGATSASGAVYISMAADEIYSNRMTMTGSIGVKMTSYDASELMEKIGIKETTVTSGANKNMFSSTSPVTDEQIEIVQSMIDESYEIFIDIISESRNIPIADVRELADGRIYTPVQALELNLIDGICTYDEFFEYMESKSEFENCEFYVMDNYVPSLFESIFMKIPEQSKSEIDVLTEILNNEQSKMYYE